MYLRMLRIQTKPELIDRAAQIFKESVIPQCKDKKGYRGAYYLADRTSGECIPMTLWETEKDMVATESSHFFQEQLLKFMSFFTVPPIKESFEVVVKD